MYGVFVCVCVYTPHMIKVFKRFSQLHSASNSNLKSAVVLQGGDGMYLYDTGWFLFECVCMCCVCVCMCMCMCCVCMCCLCMCCMCV